MPDVFESKRAQLAVVFIKRLESDVVVLRKQLASLEDGADRSEARGTIRHLSHRLAGSAQLFLFDQLTLPAQDVEVLIDNLAEDDLVSSALRGLIEAIERAIRDTGNGERSKFQQLSAEGG